jgi:hypothetical protein
VVPQSLLIEEALNEQLMEPEGLRWQFQPERLEVFQAAEMQKAAAVAKLVGAPIMTVNEGRAWMGLPPLEDAEDAGQTRRSEGQKVELWQPTR